MKKRSAPLVAATLAAASGATLLSRSAYALGPIGIEAGAKIGVGSNPVGTYTPVTETPPNPLGFGLGARGGITFMGFYGGLSAMYYLGVGEDSISQHTTMLGLEAGYGLTLFGLVTVRPQVGLGDAVFTGSGSGGASHPAYPAGSPGSPVGSGYTSNGYLEPGVTGLVSFGLWYVGADVNALVFPGLDNSKAAVTCHGQVGISL
jgi:hypothetical protein